jgi:outer membrane protein assembly factor BamB
MARNSRRDWDGMRARALVVAVALLLGGIFGVSGCSSGREPETGSSDVQSLETQRQITIRMPHGVEASTVALGAANTLKLADRVRVKEATTGLSRITSLGSAGVVTDLGADTRVGDVWSRGKLFLRSRAFVAGGVRTTVPVEKQDDTAIVGTTDTAAQFDPTEQAGWTISVPTTTRGEVQLEPDQQQSIAPGRYTNVNVKSRATLKLEPGIFIFDSLTVEPQAIVELDQSARLSEIYVLNTLSLHGGFRERLNREEFPIIGYLGTATTTVEVPYRGVIVAPDATLVLGNGSALDFVGTFLARDLEVRSEVVVVHRALNLPNGSGPGATGPVQRPLPEPLTTPAANCGPRRGLAVAAWAMRGFCPAHLGQSPFLGTLSNFQRWVFDGTGSIVSQPVVGAASVSYVTNTNGTVTALSAGGVPIWKADVGAAVHSTSALSSRLLLHLGADDGHVHAFDRFGVEAWNVDLSTLGNQSAPAFVRSSPAIDDDGQIYVGTHRGVVASISKAGQLSWSRALAAGVISSSVALDDEGLLFAATEGGSVFALSRATGATVWTRSGLGSIQASPSVGLHDVYVATMSGQLLALSRTTGATAWTAALGGPASASPAVNPRGQIVIGTEQGKVLAVSPLGATVWSVDVGSAVFSTPAIGADGIAYLATSAGNVLALALNDGAEVWRYSARSTIHGSPALTSQGYVIVGDDAGNVYALGTDPTRDITVRNNGGAAGSSGTGRDPFGGPLDPSIGNGPHEPVNGSGGSSFGSGIGYVPQGSNDLPGGPATGFPDGQESCGTTSTTGLGGLKFDPVEQMLTLDGTTDSRPVCALRFCRIAADGSEVEEPTTLEQLNTNPNTLPTPTSCGGLPAQRHCPMDPASAGAECTADTDCNTGNGEICGVFCDTATCETYKYRCGKVGANCQASEVPTEPTGPFSEDDDTTWPCQEHRECAEATPGLGFTGDPALTKTGSLNQDVLPDKTREPATPLPVYPNVSSTLFQDPNAACSLNVGNPAGANRFDPKSGGNGNQKWGVFIEPEIGHDVQISPLPFFGEGTFSGGARASLVAGANVWGKRIEAVNAEFSASLSSCNVTTKKSLKVLGIEYVSAGDDDHSSSPDVGLQSACNLALGTRAKLVGALTKALRDAKAATDYVSRHGTDLDFCSRTRKVFPDVGAACDSSLLTRWLTEYANRAQDLVDFQLGDLKRARDAVLSTPEIPLEIATHQFTGLGASMTYPVGPITVEMEIEVAGEWGLEGKLSYGLVNPTPDQPDGPYARVELAPRASANAFAYIGVGIGGVTVGVLGELELISFSTPLFTGVSVTRDGTGDPRPLASSGLFAPFSDPSLFGGRNISDWHLTSTYGAGMVLSTLSGQVDLAVRIHFLFFKKTFKKKIADWKGFTSQYEFLGKIGQPTESGSDLERVTPDVPFPAPDNLTVLAEAPLAPELPLDQLGPANSPGQCGTPPECKASGDLCNRPSECCSLLCYSLSVGQPQRCHEPPVVK